MNNKLLKIATYIDIEDRVVDVGCDHGYLSIYLAKNNLCNKIIASDINENALNNAISNIEKERLNNIIKIIISDGLQNIDEDIDTAVIAGMGSNTILNIVKNSPIDIKKYIISSNNDYELLRKTMLDYGYFLHKEIVIKDNDKFYPIMVFTHEQKKLTDIELRLGLYNIENRDYYNCLKNKYSKIINTIPNNHDNKIIELQSYIKDINNYLNR